MISSIYAMSLNGLYGELIEVQTCITSGLPKFEIVRFTRCFNKRIERKNYFCN